MNLDERLARLERQMATLVANDHVRRAFDGPQAVPLVNNPQPQIDAINTSLAKLLNNQNIAQALSSVTAAPLLANSVTATELDSTIGITESLVFAGFMPIEIVSNAISFSLVQFQQVYAYQVWSASYPVDLTNIGTLAQGTTVVLTGGDATHVITVKDGTGNLRLAGDRVLADTTNTITLVCDGQYWLEIARSTNA